MMVPGLFSHYPQAKISDAAIELLMRLLSWTGFVIGDANYDVHRTQHSGELKNGARQYARVGLTRASFHAGISQLTVGLKLSH